MPAKDLETIVIEGRHYATSQPIRISIHNGTIEHVEFLEASQNHIPWIAPGLVELQINGFGGVNLHNPKLNQEDIHQFTRSMWSQGVTSYYPTIVTNAIESIESSMRNIAKSCAEDKLTSLSIPGIHLEGPFISPDDGARGAHSKAYVIPPDWDLFQRWQDAAEGRIKIVTLAPEWQEAPSFITKCAEQGITVSIGHTSASAEQIREAVEAGARMSTHLGNGAHLMLPRHPNYIWEQLAQDDLWPCAIADLFHLPNSVLKVFLKVKPEQFMLVSDASYLSGMEPGEYQTSSGRKLVKTPEGKLHIAENPGILAGSAQMLDTGIVNLVKTELCSLAEAWDMASARPAKFMHLPQATGLEAGSPADIAVFDYDPANPGIHWREIYKDGQRVIGTAK